MARPKPELVLSDDERQKLTTWANRPKSTQRLALRARIVLACADEPSNKAVAARLGVCGATVGTWRTRFVARRLDGLIDNPRPGAPRAITDADVERVVTRTLETKPTNASHWSTRGMAKAAGLSQSAISRIWRAFGLQPHRADTFKRSTDPYFVAKVRDVVGLYLSPPDKAVVLSVDEKSGTPALDRTQPVLPMTPGRPSGAPTITSGTAPRACSRPWTWPPERSSAGATAGTSEASMWSKNFRNSWCQCRRWHLPMTCPVATFRAANRLVVPSRT